MQSSVKIENLFKLSESSQPKEDDTIIVNINLSKLENEFSKYASLSAHDKIDRIVKSIENTYSYLQSENYIHNNTSIVFISRE